MLVQVVQSDQDWLVKVEIHISKTNRLRKVAERDGIFDEAWNDFDSRQGIRNGPQSLQHLIDTVGHCSLVLFHCPQAEDIVDERIFAGRLGQTLKGIK